MPKCHFCGSAVARGTGHLYVLKEGNAYWYCSQKCEKNDQKLKRNSAKTKWTAAHHKQKEIMQRSR